jgi:hypothetical protein
MSIRRETREGNTNEAPTHGEAGKRTQNNV